MPFGDGTGPVGAGPVSGRGMGFCRGFNAPGYASGGWGAGRGRGRGWRNMYYATGQPHWARYNPVPVQQATSATEMDYLKSQADYLKNSLDAISKRIDDLEKQAE